MTPTKFICLREHPENTKWGVCGQLDKLYEAKKDD
jgi:hypothetical protein